MGTNLLLLMGPSGVGKNSLMHELARQDRRFEQIKPHVTRSLRPGEVDRVHVSSEKLLEMRRNGEATAINQIYDGEYQSAMPKRAIEQAMTWGRFPMVDYKIGFLKGDLEIEFPGKLFRVYVLPPRFEILKGRLQGAGRSYNPKREHEDWQELLDLDQKYAGHIDFKVVNKEGQLCEAANSIRRAYLNNVQWHSRFLYVARFTGCWEMLNKKMIRWGTKAGLGS